MASSALHAAFSLLATATRAGIDVSCRRDGRWVPLCAADAAAAHPTGVRGVEFVQGEEHCAAGPALVSCGHGEGGGVCVWRISLPQEGEASIALECTLSEWYAICPSAAPPARGRDCSIGRGGGRGC